MKYVFDIDNTILYTDRLDDGNYHVKDKNVDLIEIMQELYKCGNEIILHTARHWNLLEQTQAQLARHSVPYDTLVMGKPVGNYYIDDNGIKPEDFILKFRGKNNE